MSFKYHCSQTYLIMLKEEAQNHVACAKPMSPKQDLILNLIAVAAPHSNVILRCQRGIFQSALVK